MNINEYFDKIYILNLRNDFERKSHMQNIIDNFAITNYLFWVATTPDLFKGITATKPMKLTPPLLACLNSHLSIYRDALTMGYKNILILEDDIIFRNDFHHYFETIVKSISDENLTYDLLYLAYIKTTTDTSHWTYTKEEILPTLIKDNLIKAVNFWSCMAYGISEKLMVDTLNFYSNTCDIEIDRYFVDVVQKGTEYGCIGSYPQLIAGTDNYSNTSEMNLEIFTRSANPALLKKEDFYWGLFGGDHKEYQVSLLDMLKKFESSKSLI